MIPKIKTRRFEESNYSSIFINGKTLRVPLNKDKDITELRFPEFLDISMGSFCSGNCKNECYASAKKNGIKYTNLAQKINSFFGSMTENQRPYQVACGGEGDSMENEECWEAMDAFVQLGITPNITTHGLFINDKNIDNIKKYGIGGVAISMHDHLETAWDKAIRKAHEAKIRLNAHYVFSDASSIEKLEMFYQKYILEENLLEYMVLLPRMNVGYAALSPKKVDYKALTVFTDKHYKDGKLAFGANAANWLYKNDKKYKIQMHPPEIFSKYLLLNDRMEMFNNSFERKPVPFTHEVGCELGHSRTIFPE